MAHNPVKPEKVAATAATLLERKLVVPTFFARKGIDEFKGAEGDAVSVVVPGVLPYRRYGWRNDRSQPIQFDEYSERKVTVTFGDDVYSAVKLTDEQKDFDFGGGFGRLIGAQTDSIRRGLEHESVDALRGAPYEVFIDAGEDADIRKVARAARQALNRLNVPDGQRVLLLGTDWEEKALADDALSIASAVGETRARAALERAIIGELYGLTIAVSQEIASDSAYAFVRSAFIFLSGTPSVPQSVPFGGSGSSGGELNVGLRWLMDYDTERFQDRSVFNMYPGFQYVEDPIVAVAAETPHNGTVSKENHFVRAVEIKTSGSGNTVSTTTDNEELSEFTGIPLAGS
ncbi:phage major capsid protein [Puerhibacterium puerhi]|uniref:phage major capsid protein n=1 Tax=Puerhibacterium puerhi TaxID=2692623 RepID=UPI001358A870|nr:hypothetical protein [Puerhibacterium puerhi]